MRKRLDQLSKKLIDKGNVKVKDPSSKRGLLIMHHQAPTQRVNKSARFTDTRECGSKIEKEIYLVVSMVGFV